MSVVSATGGGVSWLSNITEPSNLRKKQSLFSHLRTAAAHVRRQQILRNLHIHRAHCSSQVPIFLTNLPQLTSSSSTIIDPAIGISKIPPLLADLDPAAAKLAIGFLGPFLSGFGFLFILRIVMSWYPKLPVEKFPYVIAYAPTEPVLVQTRKVIPPLAGVDVTPVVWFGLISFLNEILVGPQGLLVLLSQQV